MGLSFATYATSNPKPANPAKEKEVPVVVREETTQEETVSYGDFAVYCRIYDSNGKLIKECWLCNCPAPQPKQKL